MFGGNGGTPATLTPVTPVGGAATEPIMVTMNSTPQSQEFRGYSKSGEWKLGMDTSKNETVR